MQTRLVNFLHPHCATDIKPILPKGSIPVWPWYTSVSRCEYKPDAFSSVLGSQPVKEIVALPNHGMPLVDLIDRRALELLKLDGPVFVMWSGGIDSTTVLTSILKNWPKEDLKRVTVLCNTLSLKENKSFFKHVVKNFKIEQSTHNLEPYCKRGYVVTGEFGDQILGSDVTYLAVNIWGEQVIFDDYKKFVPQLYKSIHAEAGADLWENYRHIANEAPFELKTVFDFCWWLNFTQKWQHVQYRCLMSATWKEPGKYFPKIIHFFENDYFQVWSIYNHEKKITKGWADYKNVAKQYIMDYSKDPGAITQYKIASGPNLYVGIDYIWAIDENWKILSKEEAFQHVVA
jgi:hypothetical protein